MITLPSPDRRGDAVGTARFDALDLALVCALSQDPRLGTSELAARLGVARNTVQARYRRLTDAGVLGGFTARVDLTTLGLPVTAFVHLQLAQGALASVTSALSRIPQVLEASTTTGASDVMVRLACRSHLELQSLIQDVLNIRGVVRSTTEIALDTPVPYRIEPLLAVLADDLMRSRSGSSRRR